uniref:Uncharacterized protein n=1 Tax=Phalaenopsis aphrodite subsp. formosana TaxID=308872 RepID=Q3BAM7_PHAAO|nr:hypothetical protein PhapfoPp042 [Phalaenopsis aphrodite subsp. formosana]AAW82558.1 hypothetical protein [Phalaenopsis aphrodite subsp. formosana]
MIEKKYTNTKYKGIEYKARTGKKKVKKISIYRKYYYSFILSLSNRLFDSIQDDTRKGFSCVVLYRDHDFFFCFPKILIPFPCFIFRV